MSFADSCKNFFLKIVEETELSRKQRVFKGAWNVVFKTTAICYSLFLMSTAVSGVIPSSFIRGVFILFISVMIFMKYPATARSPLNRPRSSIWC